MGSSLLGKAASGCTLFLCFFSLSSPRRVVLVLMESMYNSCGFPDKLTLHVIMETEIASIKTLFVMSCRVYSSEQREANGRL